MKKISCKYFLKKSEDCIVITKYTLDLGTNKQTMIFKCRLNTIRIHAKGLELIQYFINVFRADRKANEEMLVQCYNKPKKRMERLIF